MKHEAVIREILMSTPQKRDKSLETQIQMTHYERSEYWQQGPWARVNRLDII
jgi:hypothetical protein